MPAAPLAGSGGQHGPCQARIGVCAELGQQPLEGNGLSVNVQLPPDRQRSRAAMHSGNPPWKVGAYPERWVCAPCGADFPPDATIGHGYPDVAHDALDPAPLLDDLVVHVGRLLRGEVGPRTSTPVPSRDGRLGYPFGYSKGYRGGPICRVLWLSLETHWSTMTSFRAHEMGICEAARTQRGGIPGRTRTCDPRLGRR